MSVISFTGQVVEVCFNIPVTIINYTVLTCTKIPLERRIINKILTDFNILDI